ncbi:MAG: sigma 54-interacting transcriptional regulator [Thermincola sp.]|jgi:PAS domain S-box-containing protein|nr:sigma 54-interacting transcriptional regulator [Thermincola sp.]MDT3702019.1 sigma 54-interacting transcriptional regulator [Thermincola sp.]
MGIEKSDLTYAAGDDSDIDSLPGRSILESMPNGIIAINHLGNIIFLNEEACRLLGVEKDAIGQPIRELFPTSNLPEIYRTGNIQYGYRLEVNGRTLISNRSPIICNNKIVGALAVFQDLTELEKLSSQLASVQQLNLELDAIIESSYDGVMITDHEGRGIRINNALARLTGLDASHFEGKFIKNLFETGIFEYESITVKALREGRTVNSIQKVSTTGKEVFVTGNPIFDADGKVARVVTNVRDLTELNRLNKELHESKLLASRYQTELSRLIVEQLSKEKVIAKSPGMMEIFNLAVRAAQTDATVLILGESGVGKEVLSRVIHNASSRAGIGTFVQINCGAIPENLLESELFGYEGGAFTGASREGKPGMFEIADRGTLLLDEIGDLPTNLQVKLLRVLQEHEMFRIGGTKPIKLDVRIIAATNQNIWERVQEGVFREDLFYRLNVLPIEVPPLRARKEDILPLAMHFIQLYNEKYRVEKRLDPACLPILESYSWPGNVRELQNVLERLLVLTDGDIIEADQVQKQLTKFGNRSLSPISVNELMPIQEAKEMLEKKLISMAFETYPSIRKAAEALGIDHSNILRKAAKYGLQK